MERGQPGIKKNRLTQKRRGSDFPERLHVYSILRLGN
jgi:hypothetical protein